MHLKNAPEFGSRIREEAARLGFFKMGIAPVVSLPHDEHFRTWLQQGFNGEMRYLERQFERRRDPRLVFAGTRSLLVLATNYYTGDWLSDAPLKGRISRYAWGDDYHEAIKLRLDRLLTYIQSLEPSVQGCCYVDTGPVMEKAWGAQTALGWIGKHTNLISRNFGSRFFLGIIMLNIDLEHDSKETDYCGKCSRCISACPTGAIAAPYVLDARLCLSYLTIELRGAIPRNLRPLIGNRIFGCDECQDACPWNRFAKATSDKGFYPREGNAMPDLLPLARITPEEFSARFKDSPILRATRNGFVRNVVVALGNSGCIEAVPVLAEALRDASPLVRSHAAWALGAIASPRNLQILESARVHETDESVLQEIAFAMGNRPDKCDFVLKR
jgi:epoxyqueuosine reductase